MGRRYDIIQTPKNIRRSDLPGSIEVSKPFMINDCLYVCERSDVVMKICVENGDKTTIPSSNKHFYVIRKL